LVRKVKYIIQALSFLSLVFIVWISSATYISNKINFTKTFSPIHDDTISDDTAHLLPYPFSNGYAYPFDGKKDNNSLYLKNPPNVADSVYYDPETNSYIFTNKSGVEPPNSMSFDDFQNYDFNKSLEDYWKERNDASNSAKGKSGIPKIHLGENIEKFLGGTIDIRPQGSAELIFGLNAIRRDDPSLDVKQRKTANFDFQEKIQMNVTAKIGDKIQLGMNYNTEASFDFDNKMKLAYEGKEDEIIKSIEAGDVTFPLNSTLIQGTQSLFGIKTKLQFGKTTVTSVFSQQKSQTSTINVSGGAQTSNYNIKADQYDENKHFFIAQYFRSRYNGALKNLPIVNSNINITKMEVWVTNIGAATTENRNVVAFMDLGENNPYNINIHHSSTSNPSNHSNTLYDNVNNSNIRNIYNTNFNTYLASKFNLNGANFTSGQDFEKVELARKLLPTEYTFNSKLGFISLNTTLNSNQVLAVAYQYTIIGSDSVYQVGDFSADIQAPNALIVKLLKSSSLNTKIPLWNLMMKNVYSLGAYQVNKDGFRLNIVFTNSQTGVPTGFFSEGNDNVKGIPIIRIVGLDNLNTELDPTPDGVFDFIDNAAIAGGTIQASNGRVYFPVLEPFGKDLRTKFNDNTLADKYCYDSLYTMTKTGAQQYPDKDKYFIQGTYKASSGSDISLNAMNVPQGSVKVTAGGIQLTENVDYTVDYTLGRVKIINQGILNSGAPIQISLESNSLFNIQTKTLMGAHFDHVVNKNLTLGATILNLTEKPITQKVNFGDEPISNTIWGLNGNYEKESMFITKMLDKLPFYSTKTPSKIKISGEFADLIPGHAKAVGKSGTSYIDDFEGSQSYIDMKNIGSWFPASTPEGQDGSHDLFPEGKLGTGLAYRFNAARLCWYVIDPSVFVPSGSLLPPNISTTDLSNHNVRIVYEKEVFPNKQSADGIVPPLSVLNLAFYPAEKGQYNYDTKPVSGISAGIASDGSLNNPETRWGGIMRSIETTDFEATNMEYIEFWMMDPFIDPNKNDGSDLTNPPEGDLYFDLGDISEDVLRDSRKSFENGLPLTSTVTGIDTTIWGRVPSVQALTNSFDNNPDSRQYQDVGLDGLSDNDERSFFDTTYLKKIAALYGTSSVAYQNAYKDPSSDDYHYFRGTDYDNASTSILDRYKKYNGVDGNSPSSSQSTESYPTQETSIPNGEDIDHDNTLNESERYFQYKVQLRLHPSNEMVVGQNYITDIQTSTVKLANNSTATVKWYQFKIPINSPDKKVVGNIQDFKSIRFMRMFMKGWSKSEVLRFATLQLTRGEWRKYDYSLLSPGEYVPNDNVNNTVFDLSAVNLEENGSRTPVPYVLPPGIAREVNQSTTTLQQLNEQSLSLKVCNLIDGDDRECYKTCNFDLRKFKNLQMFVHEEAGSASDALSKGDLTVFMRLGTDFTDNYYEYEIPLTPTPWNTPAADADAIWPDANSFNITLSVLENAKLNRNTQMRTPGSGVTLTAPYYIYDNGHKITIVGNPTLSDVQVIMVGVRNPKKSSLTPSDDGLSKCAEVWVDELRLTGFIEKGGWAATSTINANLADLGTATLAGKISTPGFGGLEQGINDLSKETTKEYDIATTIELGKFLPEKTGIKIPMHFDYSHTVSTPQYNPLDPDVLLTDDLNTYTSTKEKDTVKKMVQDYTVRKSLNFMNVKKEKTGTSKKAHIYDVENLDFSYSYTEQTHRDIDIEHDLKKEYKGSIGYNYSNTPKNFMPLSKVKFLSYGPLKLIKDFNFYIMPKTLMFRTDMDRFYSEDKLRNTSDAVLLIDTTFVKSFTWDRNYGMKFDLTQNLKVDYTATADARIDEPAGRIDKAWKRDSVISNIKDFGRMTNYDQALNVNYAIPINKISWFNWITSSAKYTGTYSWMGAPLSATSLGNNIENSNTKQLNGNFNLTSLYNKVGYLKKLNQQKSSSNSPSKNKDNDKNKDKGKSSKNKYNSKNKKNQSDSTKTDSTKVDYLKNITDNVLKFIMGIKTVSFNYSQGNGTSLPGFMPNPSIIGMDNKWNSPGFAYVFGDVYNIGQKAEDRGWLSKDSVSNNPYASKFNENFTARATIEPFSKFLIELTSMRTFSRNNSEFIKWDTLSKSYQPYNQVESGGYSVSFLSLRTAFARDNKTTNSNAIFENFLKFRYLIAWRLARRNKNWLATQPPNIADSATGQVFPAGYGPTSQDVLIPAFLAAYTHKNPNSVSLDAFSDKFSLTDIPLPNWRITYDGLSKLDFVRKYLKVLSLSNSYRSTYIVGAYSTDMLYGDGNKDGLSDIRDQLSGNYIPIRDISQISIAEQFNPLINVDMTWNNSLLSNFEIKRSRDLALSFANDQLTEVSSSEYIIGLGYRIKNVVLNVKGLNGGKTKKLKSDLNIKADISFKSNKTVLRQIVDDVNQISTGQRIISINTYADYLISKNFTIKIFFDKIITNPFVSSQFPNSTTNAGFSLKFTLSQ